MATFGGSCPPLHVWGVIIYPKGWSSSGRVGIDRGMGTPKALHQEEPGQSYSDRCGGVWADRVWASRRSACWSSGQREAKSFTNSATSCGIEISLLSPVPHLVPTGLSVFSQVFDRKGVVFFSSNPVPSAFGRCPRPQGLGGAPVLWSLSSPAFLQDNFSKVL